MTWMERRADPFSVNPSLVHDRRSAKGKWIIEITLIDSSFAFREFSIQERRSYTFVDSIIDTAAGHYEEES